MTLGARIRRGGGAPSLARPLSLAAYLRPIHTDLVKIPDISGNGNHATYNIAPAAANVTDTPPAWATLTLQATTPVLAAARPSSFTIQVWEKIVNSAGTYATGATPGADAFLRTTVGDLRAYVIASDQTGNFLISADQTPTVGTWVLFSLVCAPNSFKLYQNAALVAQLAGKTARPDSFAYRYNWNGSAFTTGVSLIYLGVALSQAEIAQNLAYLRARHRYP